MLGGHLKGIGCFTANGALTNIEMEQMLLVGAGSCLVAQKQIGWTPDGASGSNDKHALCIYRVSLLKE